MSLLFPELEDEDEGDEPEVSPSLEWQRPLQTQEEKKKRATAAKQRSVGGAQTRASLERLLDFSAEFPDGVEIGEVVLENQDGWRLSVTLGGPALGALTVQLYPPDRKGFITKSGFSLAYQGSALTPVQARALEWIAKRLEGVGFNDLRAVVERDPEASPEAQQKAKEEFEASSETGAYGPDALLYAYGNEYNWYNFFSDQEGHRTFGHKFTGGIVDVHHTEIECEYQGPREMDGTLGFYNLARADRDERKLGSGTKLPDIGDNRLMTDIQDRDVIKGALPRLDALLDDVAREKEAPKLLLVRSSCVPMVTGDDLGVPVGRFEEKTGLPVLQMGLEDDPYESMLRALAKRPELLPRDVEVRPNTVNLIGYPAAQGLESLDTILAAFDVTVNARLFPVVDGYELERLPEGELQVLYNGDIYTQICELIQRSVPVRDVRPPAPYGFGGTRIWLEEIIRGLGRMERPEFEARWTKLVEPLTAEWDLLRKEARRYRLGFVDSPDRRLQRAQHATGVPFVNLLHEMGFGIDLLLLDDGSEIDESPEAQQPPLPATARVLRYSNPAQLEERLRASSAAAFFSGMTFDPRLSRTGKGQFSISQFEMGPSGAVASLERLLAICRTPFYRVYGRYLGPAFEGAVWRRS